MKQKRLEFKGYFPLPFIDQVLDALARQKYFSFLDYLSRVYHQISISPKDQDKRTLPTHGLFFPTKYNPLVFVMHLQPSKELSLPYFLTLSMNV